LISGFGPATLTRGAFGPTGVLLFTTENDGDFYPSLHCGT
jgi:hypothetical protein